MSFYSYTIGTHVEVYSTLYLMVRVSVFVQKYGLPSSFAPNIVESSFSSLFIIPNTHKSNDRATQRIVCLTRGESIHPPSPRIMCHHISSHYYVSQYLNIFKQIYHLHHHLQISQIRILPRSFHCHYQILDSTPLVSFQFQYQPRGIVHYLPHDTWDCTASGIL